MIIKLCYKGFKYPRLVSKNMAQNTVLIVPGTHEIIYCFESVSLHGYLIVRSPAIYQWVLAGAFELFT